MTIAKNVRMFEKGTRREEVDRIASGAWSWSKRVTTSGYGRRPLFSRRWACGQEPYASMTSTTYCAAGTMLLYQIGAVSRVLFGALDEAADEHMQEGTHTPF